MSSSTLPLGAQVFRPAAAEGGVESPPAEPATVSSPACAASRLRPAGGSEDPRTQRTTAVRALFSTVIPAVLLLAAAACTSAPDAPPPAVETTALWLFDEPAGLYPSHTLDDMSDNDMVLTLGLGAQVVPGRYGNALLLAPLDPPLDVPPAEEKPGEFGLARLPVPEGTHRGTAELVHRSLRGAHDLRREPPPQAGRLQEPHDERPQPRRLRLDRRVLALPGRHRRRRGRASRRPTRPPPPRPPKPSSSRSAPAPRGENDIVTRLTWSADRTRFVLVNQPSGAAIEIPTAAAAPAEVPPADAASAEAAPTGDWRHYALHLRLRHQPANPLRRRYRPTPVRPTRPPSKPSPPATRPTSSSPATASSPAPSPAC